MTTYRFALRNFLGHIVRRYAVEANELKTDAKTTKRIGHHVLIVDASGSMYGDISGIKEMVRKMLTLDEYRDSDMLVSLLSYSSSGDLIEHFLRARVGDIVKSKNTKAQREIGSLRARGMTCMTQALEAALQLVRPVKDELTAVSLHTDGYFNDPSPASEFRKLGALIDEFKRIPDVFVNTIGYRDYCDFAVLGKIANALSGRCIQARDIKTYYDAIYDTTQLLAGQSAPAITLERCDCDYQVFVSSDGKIVGSGADELKVCGVAGDAARTVFRFREINEMRYDKLKDDLSHQGALAFARAQLAEGRVNAAKYAVISTNIPHLIDKHMSALSSRDLAAFGEALEKQAFSAVALDPKRPYGVAKSASVPAILAALAEHRDDFYVDFKDLVENYQRRGLRRLAGSWEGDRLKKPHVRTELRDADDDVAVGSFEFNRNNATINMMIPRKCRLIAMKDGKEIKELAGVKLDLTDFKQYTLVGDGALNVPSLRVRVTGKKLWKKLGDLGAVAGPYDPKAHQRIDFSARPLVEYGAKFDASLYKGLAERLARLHTADKLVGALVKGKSADFSPEQVLELSKHYITPNLYVSTPTTNPYTDLQKAIADGEVDARTSYRVCVGSPELLDPSDLYSANEFLRRWYECTAESIDDPKKAQVSAWFDSDFEVKHKKLSARTKVGAADKIMAEIFDEFFCLNKKVKDDALEKALGPALASSLWAAIGRKKADRADALAEVKREVGEALDRAYVEWVQPLVHYVGASGLIPDDFGDCAALTPEQLVAKYPQAELSKGMKEDGIFYDIGGGAIITVLAKSVYFSTEKGLERAKEIEGSAVASLG